MSPKDLVWTLCLTFVVDWCSWPVSCSAAWPILSPSPSRIGILSVGLDPLLSRHPSTAARPSCSTVCARRTSATYPERALHQQARQDLDQPSNHSEKARSRISAMWDWAP